MTDSQPLILLLSRYFSLLTSMDEAGRAALFVNSDFSRMTFLIRVHDHRSSTFLYGEDLEAFSAYVDEAASELRAEGARVELWGSSLRFLTLAAIVERDQWISSAISVALVLAFTAIVFRSLRFGLIALIPLTAGILLNFISMAVTGIPLDMTTASVFCVAIGIGVDNAIHFLIQYQRQRRAGFQSIEELLERTLVIAGRPIVLTTASIVAGLAVLVFASFKPILFFGLLVALALVTTTAATLFVLPAILAIVEKVRSRRAAAADSG